MVLIANPLNRFNGLDVLIKNNKQMTKAETWKRMNSGND